jgi:hypothetical protein
MNREVKVKVTLQLTVSQSVSLGVEPHLGLMTRYLAITIWQLQSCFCGAPSLKRGRVCLFYMLLALASVVFLGSESLGTRDHILLSQIWDFRFRRLLRLAGLRWRYSKPPPHGLWTENKLDSTVYTNKKFWEELIAHFPSTRYGPHRKRRPQQFFYCCMRIRFSGNIFAEPLPSNDEIHIQTQSDGMYLWSMPLKWVQMP